MNGTRVFLLNIMANATTLEEFFLGYKALHRLQVLTTEELRRHTTPPVGVSGPRPMPQQGYPTPQADIAPRAPVFRTDDIAPDYDSMGGGALPFDL